MFCAYDTSQLLGEDTLLKVQHISNEIGAIHKSIDRVEREVTSIEKHIRSLTKVEAWRLGQSNCRAQTYEMRSQALPTIAVEDSTDLRKIL